MNDGYQLAESQWEVMGLEGFGSLLRKQLDLLVSVSVSPSSSHILS